MKAKRKARTLTLDVDLGKLDGVAWSAGGFELVLEDFADAQPVKRVRIPLRPATIEYLVDKLKEAAEQYHREAEKVVGLFR